MQAIRPKLATGRVRSTVIVRVLVLAAMGLAVSVGACNDGPTPVDSQAVTKAPLGAMSAPAAQPLPPVVVSFELTYPTGTGIETSAIGAGGSLTLGVDDRVLAADGSPGAITSTGTANTTVGWRTSTGAIVSVPNVIAGPSVTSTAVTSGGTVTAGPGARLGTITEHATLSPYVRRSFIGHTAGAAPRDIIVGLNGSQRRPRFRCPVARTSSTG